MRIAALFVLGIPLCLPAQIVVSGGGPNLANAVAAAPDGAVLVVQPGVYDGFTISGKGFTILGGPGVDITDSIWVSYTQVHQSVTVRGLSWPTTYSSVVNTLLLFNDCAGTVTVESVTQPPITTCGPSGLPAYCVPPTGTRAVRCSQVALRGCTIDCSAGFTDSDVVIESCTIKGTSATTVGSFTIYGNYAVIAVRSRLQVCGTSLLRGGDNVNGPWPAPTDAVGLYLTDSNDVRLLDGIVSSGMAGNMGAAVLSTGPSSQVRLSPRVQILASGPTAFLGLNPTPSVMPELTGTGATPGGTLGATVTTENGDLVILAVGLPGPSITVPGLQDAFWIDPAVYAFVAVSVQQNSAPIAATIAVPNSASFRGLRLNWGAACQGPVTGFQASNPVVTLVY